ncbi:MAG: M20 family metallo-hydrolase [Verrucomicrobiota bacterium]
MIKETPIENIHRRLLERIEILGTISSDEEGLSRIFLSKEMDIASRLIQSWMNSAGLVATIDPLQNVVGSWPSDTAKTPSINLGSHYDTVIDAGKYDGVLGVLLSIAAIELLQAEGYNPRHHINALAFCDEEGVRFQTTFLGSSLLCGSFDMSALRKVDNEGLDMRNALKARGFDPDTIPSLRPIIQPKDVFLEAHIEQGPALEAGGHPLGVVDGIAAQTRINGTVTGKAGHAGTTPPNLRSDALACAAEMVLAVETFAAENPAVRATVGKLDVSPNASNAIPGSVSFTIDFRHPKLDRLIKLKSKLLKTIKAIAKARALKIKLDTIQETSHASCDPTITELLSQSVVASQGFSRELSSGAGHDAMKVAETCRIGMLFIRCRDGLSHHPDEYVEPSDILAALRVWADSIKRIDQNAFK